MTSVKYIGMDVHQKSISIAVMKSESVARPALALSLRPLILPSSPRKTLLLSLEVRRAARANHLA